jgi:uncharacterized protein (DUF302 family)
MENELGDKIRICERKTDILMTVTRGSNHKYFEVLKRTHELVARLQKEGFKVVEVLA